MPIDNLNLAKKLREGMAESGLPRLFAKLYSQHSRLQAGMPGLAGWGQGEAEQRLTDAARLIQAALIEKEHAVPEWNHSMRRAAEILEWLSHASLNPEHLPVHFLSAAAYQLAGYPARSLGLLNSSSFEAHEHSDVLKNLLVADFPKLFNSLSGVWLEHSSENGQNGPLPWGDPQLLSNSLRNWTTFDLSSALGILGAYMRWGVDTRLTAALQKIESLAGIYSHAQDPYSWLLARLCSEVSAVFTENSLRHYLVPFSESLSENGKKTIERYLRQSFLSCKTLAWPSQVRGIRKLIDGDSFALCTPTASGKTTVAELAIIQSLSSPQPETASKTGSPMVVYLVPSKALASEVESKLSAVMEKTSEERVAVSGMYGGTDWGPTDAWLTSGDKAVAVCTYEKAEALLRFLGPLFLKRLCLVIIDEAHQIQFDQNLQTLKVGENRSLRLESLCMRLLTSLKDNSGRIIALSAVASGSENAIAGMISGSADASPITTYYRSTRQLVGRLECLPGRRFEIRYDVLDGADVKFDDTNVDESPYIRNPFPAFPPAPDFEAGGPEKKLRPYLFWAAIHLAAPDEYSRKRSVLLSITQGVEGYAKDFLSLLETDWSGAQLPAFFSEPQEDRAREVWQKCLRSCEDYFGPRSREYRLLKKGIVLHHGKMPGLMGRLLVTVIQEGIANLVLATSTLSEGVNLPFEVVLIPSLRRHDGDLNIREFSNLIGRAGRPGYGTEGRSLVLLPPEPSKWDRSTQAYRDRTARARYLSLISTLLGAGTAVESEGTKPSSALAELLNYIEKRWRELTGSNSRQEFLKWLEESSPSTISLERLPEAGKDAVQALDSLDSLLLSIQVETEAIKGAELSPNELEEHLKKVWQHTYAHFASGEEQRLEQFFLKRGVSLKEKIYVQASERKKLYRTSLPPRSGLEIIRLHEEAKPLFSTGHDYFWWNPDERFNFIRDVIQLVSRCTKFQLASPRRGQPSWEKILRWWLDPDNASPAPSEAQVSGWFNYISQNFLYRFNWGLGCLTAVAINEVHEGELKATTLEDWPNTGLPWIVFWLKELIVWGTLDPVMSYLISKGKASTRKEAAQMAANYYRLYGEKTDVDPLHASQIRDWMELGSDSPFAPLAAGLFKSIKADLLRNFSKHPNSEWRVLPVANGEHLYWYDPAGFRLAVSQKPSSWRDSYSDIYDFFLQPSRRLVRSEKFL